MKYLVNSLNPSMFDLDEHMFKLERCTKKEVLENKHDAISAIGHCKIGKILGVPVNRMKIQLEPGDTAYIVRTKNDDKRHNNWYPSMKTDFEVVYQTLTVMT